LFSVIYYLRVSSFNQRSDIFRSGKLWLEKLCRKLTQVLINFQKMLLMEEWLRTKMLKRNTNDTGDANPNCDTRVVTTGKCDRSTIKVEGASS
jgi:predicted site-specific integrase-resolvase